MTPPVLGLLLAGGRARRMGGGDKCLLPLGGKPLLAHAIARARPQVSLLLLNANGDPARFARFGLPVVADPVPGFAGPLAGILAGMAWLRANRPDISWIASFATDTPFFPRDLVARLFAAVDEQGADLACAASNGRAHPVFGLWPTRLHAPLARFLLEEGGRKIDAFTARYRLAVAEFAGSAPDPFFNINMPEDLEHAGRCLGREN